MATSASGTTVPAGSDAFDPQGAIVAYDKSLAGSILIPAANATARDAIYAALVAAGLVPSTDPVHVDRLDTGVIERNNGGGFVKVGPQVRFKGYLNGGDTVTSSTNIAFHVGEDTASGWNASTNLWVCPVSGAYLIIGSIKNGATGAASSIRFIKNGAIAFASPNFVSQAYGGGSATYYALLVAGDTVAMQSGATYTCQSDAPADNNIMEIVQVQS